MGKVCQWLPVYNVVLGFILESTVVEQRTTAVASDHLVANINILKTSFVILGLPANMKSLKHHLYMHHDNDLLYITLFSKTVPQPAASL